MTRIFLIAAVLFFYSNANSQQQQEYFVFIQDVSRQPFYVRMEEESHSSSATGHIILSRLRDSTYNFFIGFPKGRSPEQLFTIRIDRKDHGYELRNMNGRWQLFDLQTLQLIDPATSRLSGAQTVMRSDSYSELMANVVDDSAVLYSVVDDTLTTDTVQIAAEVKAAADSARNDSAVVQPAQPTQPARRAPNADPERGTRANVAEVKPETRVVDTPAVVRRADMTSVVRSADTTAVASAPPPQLPYVPPTTSVRDKRDIIRLLTENVSEGKMMIYVDRTGPVNDTIRIVIPRQ